MSIRVHDDCIGNKKESEHCELKKKLRKVKKLKQEEFEQGRVLEHGKDAQTPLATVYDVHDSVSLGSDESLDARARNRNLVSANDKFLEVFGSYLNCGATAQREQIEPQFR